MEMHQVRYFLAVARELNFTRAAESCNVAQPSLTRAIKQLEDELGGELFRRERNLSHLTELGHRMLPMLQQCYDSALTAKSLAQSMKSGAVAPLAIALSVTVNIMLLISFLSELVRAFPGLELRFYRGTNGEVAELLKKGEVEVGVAGMIDGTWERLDSWPLFSEPYRLVVAGSHRLASVPGVVSPCELANERLLCRSNCENLMEILQFLDERSARPKTKHDVWTEQDLTTLARKQFRYRHCTPKLGAQHEIQTTRPRRSDDRENRLCLWCCGKTALHGGEHTHQNAQGGRLEGRRRGVVARKWQRPYRVGQFASDLSTFSIAIVSMRLR